MDKQREDFEKCAIAYDYYDLDSAQVGELWLFWQAAQTAMQPKIDKLELLPPTN